MLYRNPQYNVLVSGKPPRPLSESSPCVTCGITRPKFRPLINVGTDGGESDTKNFETLKNAVDEVATLHQLKIEKGNLRKMMEQHKATAGSLQTAHDRMKVKLQQILQTAELHIEKQREVKAPRGRPAAAASSASLYDDEMESTSQVLEDSDSDGEARGLCRSP